MEGKGSQESSLQLMFNSGGASGHTFHSAEDDSNQHFVIEAAGTERRNEGSQWTYSPKSPDYNNYVEYLTESSTNYLQKTVPTEVMLTRGDYSPVNSMHDVHIGVNGTDRSFLSSDPGKACTFNPPDCSIGLDARKAGIWRPKNEGQEANKFATTLHQLHVEGHASWTAASTREKHNNVSQQHDPRVTLGAVAFLPKPQSSSSRQKGPTTDRERRQRIADNLKALHELLPNPAEGSQAYVVDDIIDYIKYLQLQIKELSGRKLQDGSSALPLIFREGYGHYIKQQMLNEPLEEMMGKLLEEHPAAAAQLLENNGLYLLPTSLVEDLYQPILMFGAGIPPI